MTWLYIKSDVKRYFRDKGNIVMSIVFPVVFILILSNAFGSFMNNKFELSPFSVGYSISDKSPIYSSLTDIKNELKEDKITLVSLDKDAALKQISNNKLAGFVEFTDTGYKFYKNDDLKIDSSIFQSILQSISYSTGTYTEMFQVLAQYHIAPPAQGQAESPDLFTVQKLKTTPQPSALTYYGIVMIINMLCFACMAAPALINTDRKNKTNQRVALTRVSPITVFAGRVISSVIAGILQISIGIAASIILLKVDYGSKFPLVIGLMLLFSVAMSSFGVMLGYLFHNMGVTRTVIFGLSWVLNFFGGSYMQYIYMSGAMLKIVKKTPLYYINRSLVEIASQGSSSVLPTALLIILVTTVSSILIGAFVYSRKEGRLCVN